MKLYSPLWGCKRVQLSISYSSFASPFSSRHVVFFLSSPLPSLAYKNKQPFVSTLEKTRISHYQEFRPRLRATRNYSRPLFRPRPLRVRERASPQLSLFRACRATESGESRNCLLLIVRFSDLHLSSLISLPPLRRKRLMDPSELFSAVANFHRFHSHARSFACSSDPALACDLHELTFS